MMLKSLVLWMALVAVIFSAPVVNLKIKETAGLARIAENVTMGVPLPQAGAYTDPAKFTLRDQSGTIIPCEFKTLCTWNKQPTHIRWLQMNFPYTIAASDSDTVTLHSEDATQTLASTLTVQDNGATITVNTGKIRFIVKKANFNLIDQAWVDESGAEGYSDANKIVAAHSRGLLYFKNNTEYASSNDAASTAVIERQGAGQVCIKATGNLKNSGGTASLYFIVRIYAFNGSASIKMQSAVEYRHSSIDVRDSLQGVHLEVPLNLGAAKNAVVGKPTGYEQAALSAGQELYCLTKRPAANPATFATMGTAIEGSVGGAVTATFNPSTLKPKDIGWAALSDGARGCLVAMRWFWQMVPTSVETYADGKMIVGLESRRGNNVPVMFYSGTARSWETQWTFFNSMTPDAMRSSAAGMTNRLFAVAPPAWYTRQTLAVLPMVEKNQALYDPAVWTQVNTWENKLNTTWTMILNWDSGPHFGADQYGFLEWGDNTHYDASSWISDYPWRILWNGNYYGLDFTAFEQFYHTGDMRCLEYGLAHSHHVHDVHMCHFGPGHSDNGSSRYCPPAYHIQVDDPLPLLTNRTWNPSHHKTEAMYQDYYMTGNDYALQIALEGANWFNGQGTAYASTGEISGYIRRWAHDMFTLEAAYLHTRNNTYLSTIISNWEAMKTNIRNNATIGSDFMIGLGMEAVVKMYPILSPTYSSGGVKPDSIPHYLKIWADRIYSKPRLGNGTNANITVALAFLSNFYGTAYRDSAYVFGTLLPSNYSNLHKDFAQQGRSMQQAMYYLATPDSVTPVGIDRRPAAPSVSAAPLAVSIVPQPFNPSARITLAGSALKSCEPVTVRVYAANGRLVADLSREIDGNSVVFQAGEMASGVYVVRCEAGALSVARRMTLIR